MAIRAPDGEKGNNLSLKGKLQEGGSKILMVFSQELLELLEQQSIRVDPTVPQIFQNN